MTKVEIHAIIKYCTQVVLFNIKILQCTLQYFLLLILMDFVITLFHLICLS